MMNLWYDNPASHWMQALPLGNGRLGAIVFGRTNQEMIALDEETIWAGHPADNDKSSSSQLSRMRELVFSGKVDQAREFAQEHFTGTDTGYGTHLRAGELVIETGHESAESGSYIRQLDLDKAVHTTRYISNGTHYSRESFVSYVDQVAVTRFSSDQAGAVNLTIRLQSDREEVEISGQGDQLTLTGRCHDNGVRFQISAKALLTNGTLKIADGAIYITDADAVTILVDIESSFRADSFQNLCKNRLRQAARKDYAQLKHDHIMDYQALYKRMSFSLGSEQRPQLPTDTRLEAFQAGLPDNELIATFFQYGRYLTIASSRPGTLPSHLQGVWNDNKASMMCWTCDYHLDINTQMNYWPAEITNLSECHEPVFDYMESLVKPGRKTARDFYGVQGWVAHVFSNIWGYTAPGFSERWGLHVTGGAWMALHLADHYEFTEDETFLRQRAYPLLKESAEFFLDFLVEDPDTGFLVTCPSASPENVYETEDGQRASVCAGPTCDQIILRELFEFCIKASEILAVDSDLRERLDAALKRLPPFQIDSKGRLQEWMREYREPEPNHRHVMHLLGLYPFAQITPEKTPELAVAARAVLEYKMALPEWENTEWGRAWNILFYARLRDPQQAYENIKGLLSITDSNLLTFSPPHGGATENIFVLDGNAGGTAGIAEMLMQSYQGMIYLLPALPEEWPQGSIKGLRAREGYELDLDWQDGDLKRVEIRSFLSNCCQFMYRGKLYEIHEENLSDRYRHNGFEVIFKDMRDHI